MKSVKTDKYDAAVELFEQEIIDLEEQRRTNKYKIIERILKDKIAMRGIAIDCIKKVQEMEVEK